MTNDECRGAPAASAPEFCHSSFVIRHSSFKRVAYLFARYPVPSQTFCDTEMRALEGLGFALEIYSVSPPTTAFRHQPAGRPRAPVFYAPHGRALDRWEARARREGRWPGALIAEHEAQFGAEHEPARRARHALYFAELCRRRGIAHVHVHFASHGVHTALFLAHFGGPAFSFTAHGQDFMTDLGNDDLLREFCARAAFVIAVSDWSRDLLREKCPAAAHKIHRVHNGLPGLRIAERGVRNEGEPEAASLAASAHSALRLLSVGRLIEFKGFHVLIAACAELAGRGLPFTCDILGEGPWRPALAALVRQHGLEDRVRLPGLRTQAEIYSAMRACDIFALACTVDRAGACDVLPTVILEAMAAAKPVVSTALAGVPELVLDGETGRLAPPGDPLALADALAGLLRSPDERQRLGRAGRERLVTYFRAEDSARQLAAHFQSAEGGVRKAEWEKEDSERAPFSPSALPPSAFRLPPSPAPARLLYLLAHCPPDELVTAGPLPAELARLRERLAGRPGEEDGALRVFSLRPPARRLDAEAAAADAETPLTWWLDVVEFLPDGMVLEGGWRENAAGAHGIEGWREETPGSLGTEDYLLQARRALWLHGWLVENRVPAGAPLHVHAVGSGAVVCAWLLRRLAAEQAGIPATASFWLEGKSKGGARELPGSVLRRLARDFVGGRVAEDAPLVTALGEWPFELEEKGAALDEGWVARLLRWARLGEPAPHTANLLDD